MATAFTGPKSEIVLNIIVSFGFFNSDFKLNLVLDFDKNEKQNLILNKLGDKLNLKVLTLSSRALKNQEAFVKLIRDNLQ